MHHQNDLIVIRLVVTLDVVLDPVLDAVLNVVSDVVLDVVHWVVLDVVVGLTQVKKILLTCYSNIYLTDTHFCGRKRKLCN